MTGQGKLAVFLPAAGEGVGYGHVVRGYALAEALAEEGWHSAFALKAGCQKTLPFGAGPGISFHESPNETAWTAASLTERWPAGADLVVVDDYGLDASFELSLASWARIRLVIDDLLDRPHDCDMLLVAVPPTVQGKARITTKTCLQGPGYAPLRLQFWQKRVEKFTAKVQARQRKNVLVNLGGTRQTDMLRAILSGLAASGHPLDVRLVSQGADALAQEFASFAPQMIVQAMQFTDRMADILIDADFAVGAGGSSVWERATLGIPAIAIEIADNQRYTTDILIESGAAIVLRDGARLGSDDIAQAITNILSDERRSAAMGRKAAMLTDGLGARRVALRVAPERANDGQDVILRPAVPDDMLQMYAWQQHPDTRRYANVTAAPTLEEHTQWFSTKLADPKCLFNIIEHRGHPAGVVRLDLSSTDGLPHAVVSINVAPDCQRRGIALAALRSARRLVRNLRLLAEIDPRNTASLRLFQAAGFRSMNDRWYINEASMKIETDPCKA